MVVWILVAVFAALVIIRATGKIANTRTRSSVEVLWFYSEAAVYILAVIGIVALLT